jgi:thymidylate kinase
VIRGVLPDRTVVILLDPAECARRSGAGDRIEREGDEFRARVDAAYRELATMFPLRLVAVDGALPPEELAAEIHGRLRDLS